MFDKSLPMAIGLYFIFAGAGYVYMQRWFADLFALLFCIFTYALTATYGGIVGAWAVMNIIMACDMLILRNKRIRETTMKCTQCAEMIRRDARVCRFCHAEVE